MSGAQAKVFVSKGILSFIGAGAFLGVVVGISEFTLRHYISVQDANINRLTKIETRTGINHERMNNVEKKLGQLPVAIKELSGTTKSLNETNIRVMEQIRSMERRQTQCEDDLDECVKIGSK